jgi:hypothetical protein
MRLLCGGLFFVCASLVIRAAPDTKTILVFTHATVIDCTGASPQPDMTVVIAADRITAIGKSAEVRSPTNAVAVDATGKFLIPGLWDMHVHWYWKESLPLFIANGVTGARIMWGTPLHREWRKEIEQGTLVGPRLVIGSEIVDGPKPFWPGSIIAGNAAEGRQAVSKARQEGADFVKVYSGLPREAYFAIAEEAKMQGIPFEGHVPLSVSVVEASRAGQRTVEHLTGVLPACSSREPELLKTAQESLVAPPGTNEQLELRRAIRESEKAALETYSQARAEEVFAEFKKNHTWQCPTLIVLSNITYLDDPSYAGDPRLKYMPRALKSMWEPGADARFKDRTPETIALRKKVFLKEMELVGGLQRAGVAILAGTDTGNPYCFPGFGLHDELALLVRAGLTPMQALQAATLNPARMLGREQELGTIEPGKLADLVVLDANPLIDIANTRMVSTVVSGGRLFPRNELSAMLDEAERLAGAGKTPIGEVLSKTLRAKNVEAAIRQYHDLKSAQPEAYDFSEEQLNYLGYRLMGMKQTKEAIKILRLNAEVYPKSANVYDSLGEAYMNDGDQEHAIENYEKSLQLDPGNKGAVEKLKQLRTR